MAKPVKEEKPQRPFDEEAKTIFLGVMERLEAEHGGREGCWFWPKEWLPSWGSPPKGYSISRSRADGYGQFVLTGTATHRQKTLQATRLAYKLFNKKRDPRLVAPDQFSADAEWICGEFDSKTFVRHDDTKCTSRACVNPDHLRLGPNALNVLDRELKDNKGKPLPPEALDRAQDVIALFGTASAKEIADKLGLKQWQVYRIIEAAGLPAWAFLDDLPWQRSTV